MGDAGRAGWYIMNILKIINVTFADNIDIHVAFIKVAKAILAPAITISEIFDLCACKGIFPNATKVATVVSAFKQGNSRNCSNY